MTTIVVRYQTKAERADENQQLIEAVFAELDEHQPEGFTYKVFRLDDGVSFVHVMIEHDVAASRLAAGRGRVSVLRRPDRRPVRRRPRGDECNHCWRLPLTPFSLQYLWRASPGEKSGTNSCATRSRRRRSLDSERRRGNLSGWGTVACALHP